MLEADSIIYSTGTKNLLTDIYLKCQTGEIVGLLGRKGSGKSTLLKIIFGSLTYDNKSIRINGKVYDQPFTQGLVGYLSQDSFQPLLRQISNYFHSITTEKEPGDKRSPDKASFEEEHIPVVRWRTEIL